MAPPSYVDLGKTCRDVFEKGYNFNTIKIKTNNQTSCGNAFSFKTDLTHKFEDASFNGILESTMKWPTWGLTMKKKWFTDNTVFGALTLEDKIAAGVKVGTECTWTPGTGAQSTTFLGQYKMDYATFDVDTNTEDLFSTLKSSASVVLGYKGWLAGVRGQFGPDETSGTSFTLGHSYTDFQAMMTCDNMDTYKGSLYQRVTNRLESGILFGWSNSGETPKNLAIAGRYLLDPCSSIRGKVNNDSILSLGYETAVRKGVMLSLATEMDLKNFNGGEHRFGLGLEFGNSSS